MYRGSPLFTIAIVAVPHRGGPLYSRVQYILATGDAMNTTQFIADDLSVVKSGSQVSGAPVALPYMDTHEVNRRLDEHAKLLKEWEDLLNRTSMSHAIFSDIIGLFTPFVTVTGAPDVTSISQADAQRHILLVRLKPSTSVLQCPV
jgi:hypothetical protein